MEPMFIKLNYDPFFNGDELRATFVIGDVLNPAANIQSILGTMDIIDISSVLHLLTRDEQLQLARQLVEFSRPQRNSKIVERQVCTREAGELPRSGQDGSTAYQRD
ncbi:MAG: hypothetical protein FRX48_06235 [Lasallia pustulata]|uniref:Uncharacterized protein n=1 Tax=Lasallia pustulata TaxID=136370 RepID=A0A5M8PJL4_9LECA|nr:MAG: hypothetical protein FRX48_06235 [Lasallia pustulata]